MDGEGCVIAGPSGVRRQAYLRFPPPPPFPPDEYSYAYYEGKKVPVARANKNPRHSYITRYGTQENLYEEIGQMRLEEEVRYVHSKHLQVLDELNLSMEAMLMPTPPQSELTTEALMSPAACSVDSGFSSSSTGTNSLGRPNSSVKKKSPHSFWKKLPGLGSTSTLVKASPDEPRCNSGSWEENSLEQSRRSSCSDVDLSSGDESKGLDGKNRLGSKRSVWRKNSPEPGGGSSTPTGRLSKLFSKKKSLQAIEVEPRGKMPLLPEEDECNMTHRRVMSPCLPPPPHNLSPQQVKMRHIVEAIVQSENSYLATLRKLVHEYKKPLEESSPALLSSEKIQKIFHRLPEILQCHTLFSIALAEAVANWDREHRIGDVFVASFSKAVVLDIYSDFINNFSVAMDTVRTETKKKPALAEFFKVRQNNSHDRLNLFGLMVKPVQRFPQFILFLQDLLQNMGHGHPERMVLQLALTKLESLAELLNERKREAEQAQAFKQMMRCVSAKMPASSQNKYLIRHDDVSQLEINSCGVIGRFKARRLLLLNDQLVCVALSSKEENVNSQLRLTYKWSCSVNDVQVIESTGSPTLSRLLTPNGSLASTNSSGTSDSLCMEMSQLMNDYQVVSRIHDLTHNLKGHYQSSTLLQPSPPNRCQTNLHGNPFIDPLGEINGDVTRNLLDNIQREIQRKDEQMAWLDSCCLEIAIRGKDEPYTFQMNSQEARKEWITELRLARLALDTNNSPSWEVPEQELRPSTKMPLFVAAHPVYTSDPNSEVMCGCYYSTTCGKTGYLWVCTYDGNDSHISIAQTWQTSLKALTQLQISGTKVTAMEYVRSMDTVWLGTANNRLLMYSVCEIERPELTNSLQIDGDVISIKVHCDNVFVSLATGRILMFRRHSAVTEPEEICLGSEPVACILPINLSIYAATGRTINVISAMTGELQKTFTVQHEHLGGHINLMAHSGVGLWLALANSSTICLYHTETFKHLQDINVASNVVRITRCQGPVTVTGLMAVKGLLWVGTDSGLALTVPLPRLEGVPIISGRVNVSYHGHSGPLSLLLPLHDPPTVHKRPASKALASDVYGLYGQLMYVKDYEETEAEWTTVSKPEMVKNESKKEHTLITITGGQGYINYQQCCYKNITNLAHIVIWEMKL